MSFDTFTALLSSSDFPFVKDFLQRTIVIPGLDNPPKVPRTLIGDPSNANTELAQHYYCQDVMPTSEGLMSVGYTQQVPGLPTVTDFDQIFVLRDTDENNFLFSPARGKNYIFTANTGVWTATNSFGGWPGTLVTRAYVNGRTFIDYENNNIYEYNDGAGTFLPVAITGLTGATIDGISASNNYMLAWNNITLNWSSLIDPTDFVPSINTGAGSAIPQDVKGPIRCIAGISGGFIIYTTRNAVAALYTNNARAPFVFKEVSNAGGVQTPEQITIDSNLGFHYGWTTAGFQKITTSSAESFNPAVADFLAGRIFEEFDFITNTFLVSKLSADLKVKIAYMAGRFLVISYGVQSSPQLYTHALIYDAGLKRWGKLRIDHVDAFGYPYPNLLGQVTETPSKQSVAFLQRNGTVQLLLMDYRIKSDAGVLLLGRFQLVRQKMVTFQFCELENLVQAYPCSVWLLNSLDGKTFQAAQQLAEIPAVSGNVGDMKKYGSPVYAGTGAAPTRTGKNFSTLLLGTFQLNTATFTITRHGNW